MMDSGNGWRTMAVELQAEEVVCFSSPMSGGATSNVEKGGRRFLAILNLTKLKFFFFSSFFLRVLRMFDVSKGLKKIVQSKAGRKSVCHVNRHQQRSTLSKLKNLRCIFFIFRLLSLFS